MNTNLHKLSDEMLIATYQYDTDILLSELVVRYMPFVIYKAKLISGRTKDYEDIVQEGLIGLFGAVRTFDDSRGSLFKPYAIACITNRIITSLRTSKNPAKKHIQQPMSLDDDLLTDRLDYGSQASKDPQELFIRQEDHNHRQQLIEDLLTGAEKEALFLYLEGYSYKEIATALSRSTKSIDNTLQRVKKKLRNSLAC